MLNLPRIWTNLGFRVPRLYIPVNEDGAYAGATDNAELIAAVNALAVILNTLGTHTDLQSLATLATALNGYVDSLESYTDGLEGKLDTLHTDIATTIASYVDGLETLIGTSNTNLSQIHTDLATTLAAYVDGLETLIGTSNTSLAQLHTDLATTLSAFLDGLEGKLDTLAHTVTTATATIANGGNLSGSISLGGGRLVGIITPAAWTAAVLSFNASPDAGSNYYNIYDDSIERAIPSATMALNGFMLSLDPNDWRGITDIKFRSGLGAATVAQGASRNIIAVIDKGV